MKHHHRLSCEHEDTDDWMQPDPYLVRQGFKQLPRYECDLCGDWQHDIKDASRFNRLSATWSEKQICSDCAKKVVNMPEWRVW